MKNMMFSIGVGASLGSSFAATFIKANNSLEKMNENYKKLRVEELKNNNAMSQTSKILEENIAKERELRQKIIATNAERTITTNKIKSLNQEMKINNGGTKEQQKEYDKLQGKIIKLNKVYEDSKEARKNSVNKIDNEKKKLGELSSQYQKLSTEITKVENQKKRMEKIENIRNKSGAISSAGTKAIGVGATTLTAFGGTAKRAISQESAFADVKKQFDFSSKEEADKFKSEIQKIITDEKLSISVDELYAAVANAGQAGITKNEAAGYVSMSTKMGIAFDMLGSDAAESMFKLKNSFALPQSELKVLLDQINMLGNTTGANAKDITDYTLRVGNIGKAAGFSEAQIASIGATLIEQGQASEVAATGFKNISLALTKGSSATKSQEEAYSKLGLDTEQIAKDMQKDAQGTFNKVLDKLGKLNKSELNAVISELFGTESMGAVSGLLANREKMNLNIGKTKDKSAYEGSMQKEADARGATTENNLRNLQARLDIIVGQIGTALLPSINSIATAIGNVAAVVSKFQQDNPVLFDNMVQGIVYAGTALLGFGGILKAISFGMNTYATGMGIVGKLIDIGFAQKIVTAVGTVSKALMGFATANPYLLIATGIVTAGYMIYQNWDKLKEMAISLWETVTKAFKSIGEFIGFSDNTGENPVLFDNMVQGIVYAGTALLGFGGILKAISFGMNTYATGMGIVGKLIDIGFAQKIVTAVGTVSKALMGFATANPYLLIATGIVTAGYMIYQNWDKLKEMAISLWETVTKAFKSIGEFIGFSDNTGEKISAMSQGDDNFDSNISTLAEKEEKLTNASNSVNQQNNSNQMSFVYSPQITGGNSGEIKNILKEDATLKQRDFEKMYNQMVKGRERVGYGR